MSQPQDQESYYDLERDILNRTPPLQEIKPIFERALPPVHLYPSSGQTDATDRVRPCRKPKKRTNPFFAVAVLIRSLDPNSELASHAERNPLGSGSQSEAEEEDNEAEARAGRRQMSRSEVAMVEEKLPRTRPTPSDGTHRSGHQEQVQAARPSNQGDAPKKQFDTYPPPLKEGLGMNLRSSRGHEEDDEDSIKSPAVAKFAISRDDAPPDFIILPALQQPAGSLDQKPNLPNLKTVIGDLQGHLAQCASPASYSTGRTTTRESNTSTSSRYSSAAVSTPSLSIAGPSAAALHPSPLATVPEQDRDRTRREPFEETDPPADGSSSTHLATSDYKCTYRGCNAAPFKTRYLLDSHAHVHSNTRTHFCPVTGCRRGIGGQGFKRKNEMIRHGLVHTSPGYRCPFCPDDQRKYPRPDNLQRHVRKCHEGKDRDDPTLREVLDQRLEGGSRGGRRRMRL